MTAVLARRMLFISLLVLLAAPCFAATKVKAKSRTRTGSHSFLKYKVYTAQDFMEQYERDAVLRQRLVKHFHTPEAQLTRAFREELREVTFQQSGWVGTYGVKENGQIYRVRTYVRKGAKALGLADGTPLFKLPCGNPFRAVPPEPPMQPRPGMAPVEPLPSIPPVNTISVEPSTLQSPLEYVLAPDIPVAEIFEVPVTTEGSPFFFFWPPHDHHNTTVPEPGSLLLLAAGTALLGRHLARRRSEG